MRFVAYVRTKTGKVVTVRCEADDLNLAMSQIRGTGYGQSAMVGFGERMLCIEEEGFKRNRSTSP